MSARLGIFGDHKLNKMIGLGIGINKRKGAGGGGGSPDFIFTVNTANTSGGSGADGMFIKTRAGITYDCVVHWGDGNSDPYSGVAPVISHTYASSGIYQITITGTFPSLLIQGQNVNDRLKYLSVDNWGSVGFTNMRESFDGCSNLASVAKPLSNSFENNASFYEMFKGTALSGIIDFSGIVVNVNTEIERMFDTLASITKVDFSGSTVKNIDFFRAFYLCSSLTEILGIGDWDVTACTNYSFIATGLTLTPAAYDAILIGWASQVVISGMTPDFGSSQYTAAAASARNTLVTTYGWTITDGGQVP